MAISGHKTRHVFDSYNIVVDKDLANAGAMLGDYLARQVQTGKVDRSGVGAAGDTGSDLQAGSGCKLL